MRRLTIGLAAVGFVATVYFANWLVDHYGPIRVWPTHLLAPAGVYVVAKISVSLLAIPFVLGARRALPAPAPAT